MRAKNQEQTSSINEADVGVLGIDKGAEKGCSGGKYIYIIVLLQTVLAKKNKPAIDNIAEHDHIGIAFVVGHSQGLIVVQAVAEQREVLVDIERVFAGFVVAVAPVVVVALVVGAQVLVVANFWCFDVG